MAVAGLESRILLTGTPPTIESLAFANPVANYGMVSGDFAGVLADATPASYYTIEIDTNNDQMSDLSGMTGSPGSFSSYGSMPLGTTSVQARAMEYDSASGQYAYGDWQQFTVSDGLVANTLPTIAALTFANPSASYGSVNGEFAGSLTDATPSNYYTIEIDTNGDLVSDSSGMAGGPGSFSAYGSLGVGTTGFQARVMEYVSATGQYAYSSWQEFTVSGLGSSSGTGAGSGESGNSGSGTGGASRASGH